MILKNGWYSLFQYYEDLARREPVNVGVILICPGDDFQKAWFLEDLSHLRLRIGVTFREELLRGQLDTVKAWADREPNPSNRERWDAFAGRLGNEIQMTPLRAIRFEDPQTDLERLIEQVVKPARLLH